MLQAMPVDGADAAGSVSNHTDVFRKTDIGLSHAPLNVGRQISFAIAGEVDVHLARPEIQIQPGERDVAKMQISLPGPHIHFQLQRDVLAEVQVPVVLRTAEMDGVRFLRNVELADAAVHVVINARLVEAIAAVTICVENMALSALVY